MIQDPYKGVDPFTRLQSRVSPDDYAFIRGLFAMNGAVQTITNHLIKHLVETIKKHGIVNYTDNPRLETLLTKSYPLVGLSPTDIAGRGCHQDVRGPTPGGRKKAARKQAKPSNPKGKSAPDGRVGRGPVAGGDEQDISAAPTSD